MPIRRLPNSRLPIKHIVTGSVIALVAAACAVLGQAAVSASAPVNEQSAPGVRAYMDSHTFTQRVTVPFQVGVAPVDPSLRTSTRPGDPKLAADAAGGVFFATQFKAPGSSAYGYIGVQANSLVVLSVWDATGCRTSAAPSSFCSNFDESGPGWTVRISYPWRVGRAYALVLTAQGSGWWNAAIEDTVAGMSTPVGSVRLPSGATGIAPSVSWIEWFHAPRNGHCTDSPDAEATFSPIVGDNGVRVVYRTTAEVTCVGFDVATVGADGSATIGSFPQPTRQPTPVPQPARLPQRPTSAVVTIANAADAPGARCLAAPHPTHGAGLGFATCGSTTAQFVAVPAGSSTVTLHPVANPLLCVDLPYESTSAGTQLAVGTCTGHDSQRWFQQPRAGGAQPALVNLHSLLSVQPAATSPAVAQQAAGDGTPAQGWSFRVLGGS